MGDPRLPSLRPVKLPRENRVDNTSTVLKSLGRSLFSTGLTGGQKNPALAQRRG